MSHYAATRTHALRQPLDPVVSCRPSTARKRNGEFRQPVITGCPGPRTMVFVGGSVTGHALVSRRPRRRLSLADWALWTCSKCSTTGKTRRRSAAVGATPGTGVSRGSPPYRPPNSPTRLAADRCSGAPDVRFPTIPAGRPVRRRTGQVITTRHQPALASDCCEWLDRPRHEMATALGRIRRGDGAATVPLGSTMGRRCSGDDQQVGTGSVPTSALCPDLSEHALINRWPISVLFLVDGRP